ncbi:MAG: DUF2358 domain-containing protein [Thermostichales cyanobacterium SRBZ-1_bins_19]
MNELIAILKQDYARFPHQQTFAIYDPQVIFRDPMSRLRGRSQFEGMIRWMGQWFQELRLQLHEIYSQGAVIHTRWTMSWVAPLPWKPRLQVTGRSQLWVNEQGLIAAQTDYWDCSRWQLFLQLWRFPRQTPTADPGPR